ncbi:hydrolase [Gordonia lacunae]|uniref:Hydrolase n=1 Tax=Gordonia lacunae TaxID=417102 RepID=A0A243Q2L9_9ACTN|nr:hydrolase [Gordonia lacunae]OUC75521.1 hydrolase [Gordonia lacunae]
MSAQSSAGRVQNGTDTGGTAPTLWWDADTEARVRSSDQVHVIACGIDVVDAVALAIECPETVLSLILAEPAPLPTATIDALPAVAVPTLVLASAPHADTDLAAAQTLAGDIDNGVFVVLDGAPAPAHTERRKSFEEWAVSFVAIAEGLAARDGRLLAQPTPLIDEGVLR